MCPLGARAPLAKSFEMVRWESDDLTRTESDFQYFNDKPFLIICDKTALDEAAQELIARAKLIYKDVDFFYYELDINNYKKAIAKAFLYMDKSPKQQRIHQKISC